ncbi:MAG: DNA repair protein RecN [Cytophagales bacterium]|nr:DNA repair protein RecN [Cytophagales bacterium]MDW8384812.1 DNA repair protein RecN [Flammeovirgaceae bacterium]
MLRHLLIKNYVLIEQLEIEPSPSFNIITGETGAGKSIMLGAVGLLMGNRAETKVMYHENEKCIIEGTFDISSYDLQPLFQEYELDYESVSVIRREISPGGKSRAFINDTPVNLETLKTITSKLIDIHSQHDTLQLVSDSFQLAIVDTFAQNQHLKEDYLQKYHLFKTLEKRFEQLCTESQTLKTELDYLQFQFEELQKAKLEEIQQQALESELKRLENAEQIKTSLLGVCEYLSNAEFSAISGIKLAIQALGPIAKFSPQIQELRQRLDSCRIEIQDIASEAEQLNEELLYDAERIETIKNILNHLYTLQQKHRAGSVQELIGIRNELQKKLSRALNYDEEIAQLQKDLQKALNELETAATSLSQSRKKVLEELSTQINDLLKSVGMPNSQFYILHNEANALTPSGKDEIKMMFSANKGIKPQELKNVASGGEFSRLMLCIKYLLAQKTALPTIIFDEIDTGISGEIALKMGNMVKEMSKKHQVIVITHLPQMAAKGDKHFYVYKESSSERTVSLVRELTQEERVYEIAQMIGGAAPSSTAFESARELMKM